MILAILLGALLLVPHGAHAATLFVAPSSGQFAVGQTFNVVVSVNSQGTAVNASEGVLSFNPAQLQVQSITLTGSIFNLNVQEPEYSNSAGTVRWTGVILNPGYTGSAGNLITVRFKGIVAGTTSVKYSSGAVLANDGAGTNVLSGMSGGTYTIGPIASPTVPTPTAPTAAEAPVVTSPTHPDPKLWFQSNDPVFKWQLPVGVDGVSYLINEKETGNPGNASDGLVSEVAFTDVPDGATYFHVKFRSGGVWGPIAHYPFNTDSTPPAPFTVIREDAEDTTNPRPLVSFATTDAVSGIARYMMRIDDGEWFEVPESSPDEPFAVPLLLPGNHVVSIEAVDRAGNSTSGSTTVTVAPITRPVIESYPPKTDADIAFDVAGSSDPQVTVTVYAVRTNRGFGHVLYNDNPAATYEVTSLANATWGTMFTGLRRGVYQLTAVAVDSRGAHSLPSEPVFVQVGALSGWLAYLWRGLVVAALLWLIAYVSHGRTCTIAPRTHVTVPASLRKESEKLSELLQDMDDELALLKKVAENRPLYPEEKYLHSKLSQYRKTVKVLLRDPRSRLAKRK